jgi:hypothetical protein
MRVRQVGLLEGLADKLPQPAQWIGFLERLIPAVYEADPELSSQCKRVRDTFDYFVNNIDCIDYDEHFPKPITSRVVIDYLCRGDSHREVGLRRVLSRVDQTLGRRKMLELAGAV